MRRPASRRASVRKLATDNPERLEFVTDMRRFIESMPKVELHVHVEGIAEPELEFKLARRNGIELPFCYRGPCGCGAACAHFARNL